MSCTGSFILSTPILIYQRIEEGYWYGPRQYCMERFPSKTHERAFILYQFIAAYLLPVLTISFCYTLMVKRVGQPTVEPVDNNYQVRTRFVLFCFVLNCTYLTRLRAAAANCQLIKRCKGLLSQCGGTSCPFIVCVILRLKLAVFEYVFENTFL